MAKKKRKANSKKSVLNLICICVFVVMAVLAFTSMFMPFRTSTFLGGSSSINAVEFLQNVDSYRASIASDALNKVFAGAVMQVIVASLSALLLIGAVASLLFKKQQKMINKANAICSVLSILFIVIAIIVANSGMAGFNLGGVYSYGLGAGLFVLLSSLVIMSGASFIVGKK